MTSYLVSLTVRREVHIMEGGSGGMKDEEGYINAQNLQKEQKKFKRQNWQFVILCKSDFSIYRKPSRNAHCLPTFMVPSSKIFRET